MKKFETDEASLEGAVNIREQDVDATRARIGEQLEQIGQRLSPGQLVDDAFDYLKQHGDGLATQVTKVVRGNPLPLLMIGAGILWLMKSTRGPTPSTDLDDRDWSTSPQDGADRAPSSGSSTVAAWRERVRPDARGSGLQRFEQIVVDRAGDVKGQVKSLTRQASHKTAQARSELARLLEQQPLVVGAIGIAAGSALGALLPATRIENEMLGGLSESLAETTRHIAADGYEAVRDQARQTVEELAGRLAGQSRGEA